MPGKKSNNEYLDPYMKYRSRKSYINWAKSKEKEDQAFVLPSIEATLGKFLSSPDSALLVPSANALRLQGSLELIKIISTSLEEKFFNYRNYNAAFLKILIAYDILLYIRSKPIMEKSNVNAMTTHCEIGNIICNAAILGNVNFFKNVVLFCIDLFELDLIAGQQINLTQIYIIKMACHFFGIADNFLDKKWPTNKHIDRDLFENLLEKNTSTEFSDIEVLLNRVLNRHTFQASLKNSDGGKDFDGYSEQFPLELLFILRLRQWRGLENKKLPHFLMAEPFDKQPPECALRPDLIDDISRSILKKVLEVCPDYQARLDNIKIREWVSLTSFLN